MEIPNKYSSTQLSEFIAVDNSTLGFIRSKATLGLALLSAKDYSIKWMDDALFMKLWDKTTTNYLGNSVTEKNETIYINDVEIKELIASDNSHILHNHLCISYSNKNGLNKDVDFILLGISNNTYSNIKDIDKINSDIELFKSILDDQPKYIFRSDEKGVISYCNAKFKNAFVGNSKLDSFNLLERVHTKDLPLLTATFARLKESSKRHFPIRLRLKLVDSDKFQLVEFDFQSITNELSLEASFAFQAVGNNAHEATLTKAHLIDKNLELSSIQQALYNSAIIAIGDKDGKILEVNQRFSDVTGFTKEELIGTNFSSLSATPKAEDSWAKFWKSVDLNSYWRGEICNKNKSGELYWLDTIISPVISVDGHFQKFISISQDITATKSIQAKLKLAKDQLEQTGKLARVGGWELDLTTSELNWSAMTKEIHEVPQDYEPQLSSAINFYKEGRDRERIAQLVQNLVEHGTAFDEEFNIITAEGNELWVRVIGNAEFEFDKCLRIFGVFQDISQLKQTQISDALNAARLEVAAEYSGIGIWEYDAKTHKEYWDEQMLRLYQYEREEFESLENPWEKKLFVDDAARAAKDFQNALDNGNIYDSIFRIVWPNNEIRYIHARGRIFRDDEGKVISIIGTNLDITEQKKLEDELRYSQYIFEQSGELAKIGSWVVNLTKPKSIEWSRITRGIHDVPDDFEPNFDEIDYFYNFESSKTDIKKLYYSAIRHKKGFDVEFRIKTYNDEIRWVRSIAHPEFNENGKCFRIIGTLQDITVQKEEAERLKTAEKLAGIGTFQYFPQTDELYWSEIAKDIFEIYKETACFEDYSSRIHKEDKQKAVLDYQTSVEKKTGFSYTHRLVMDDGRVKYANFFGENIFDNNGNIYLSRGTVQDITKEKMAEFELIKSRTEAIVATKAKSSFLANMSHEIRTPLNGVIGFNELLSHTPLNDIQQQYLANATSSAQTLLSVLNDILDFSKIEAGKLQLDPIKTDLIEVVQSTVNIFKYAAQKKNLEILIDLKPDLPSEVIVDQLRLKQVLTNLLSNAVKFTDHGSLKVDVSFERLKSSNKKKQAKFIFKIVDSGIGISKTERQKLFKAFSQADPSTSRKYGGTGLGLVISNLILGHMNSKLKLESEVGKGSTFFFELKLEYGYSDKMPQHTIDHIKNVLIVDDNVEATRILKTQLAHWGISAETVNNVDDAKKMFNQHEAFDLAILDYHMPGKTGLEVLADIKKTGKSINKDVPVILLHSSSDDANILHESSKYGVKIRLEKPLNTSDLFRALTKIKQKNNDTDVANNEIKSIANKAIVLDDKLAPNILIVEDVQLNSTLVKALIKRYLPAAKINEVVNGVEALNHYQKKGADLIFMDVQMPVMDGYEATKRIRDYEKVKGIDAVTIVALTAHAFKEERDKVLKIGMDDLLTKPIEPIKISETLAKYFNLENSIRRNDLGEKIPQLKSSPSDQIYDKEAVLNRFLFDEDLIAEMLKKAKSQIMATMKQLGEAIKLKDAPQIEKSAHKIKGIAKNMSFVKVIDAASTLEEKAYERSEFTSDLYNQLDSCIKELVDYLKLK